MSTDESPGRVRGKRGQGRLDLRGGEEGTMDTTGSDIVAKPYKEIIINYYYTLAGDAIKHRRTDRQTDRES